MENDSKGWGEWRMIAKDGEWRTRVRDRGVENDSKGLEEWRMIVNDGGSGE